MTLFFVLWLSVSTTIVASTPSIFDPRVYNYYYYVQHNPIVTELQLYTEQQAAEHWQNVGVVLGLQGCGSFHVLQFIDNYPTLIPQTNYTSWIYYYLTIGYQQNLMGYTVGGAYGKYTISSINTTQPKLGLFTSLSNRMGGSIDSIMYQNFEYINAWDHSRNLQITTTTKYGECYMTTESGSIEDAQTNHTTSNILNINATDSNIYTETAPAFYMNAGSCENDDNCGCAKNTMNVSNYRITKNIYIKYGYQDSFWINYVTKLWIAEDLDMITIRAPMVSVNSELNRFWKLDNTWNSEIYPLDIDENGGKYKASADTIGQSLLIQTTNDIKHAISILPIIPQTCNAGIWIQNNLGKSQLGINATTYQYLEFIYYNVREGTTLDLNSVICVGTLQDIQMCTGFANN